MVWAGISNKKILFYQQSEGFKFDKLYGTSNKFTIDFRKWAITT